MGRQRTTKRKGWPPNLYEADGYFSYRNPVTGSKHGLGRDRAHAFHEAKQANAYLATKQKTSLIERIQGFKAHTLETWLLVYEELWVKEDSPAQGTLATAKRFFARIRQSDLAAMPLREIETAHVAEYLDKLLTESTPSVVRNMRARLQDIFRMAQTKGFVETGKNPVTATNQPAYEVKRERLSLEQFLAIREKVSPAARNGMNIALLTGQRIGDVVSMKFSDYRDGFLFIQQQKTGFKLQQDGRIRLESIGLSIDEAIKQCRDTTLSKHIVHHKKNGGKFRAGDAMSTSGLSSAFGIARDELGIKAAEGKTPPSFHEIRSLAERLYRKEYGQEFSQAMMGHKHAKMTAEYSDMRGSGWQVVKAK